MSFFKKILGVKEVLEMFCSLPDPDAKDNNREEEFDKFILEKNKLSDDDKEILISEIEEG